MHRITGSVSSLTQYITFCAGVSRSNVCYLFGPRLHLNDELCRRPPSSSLSFRSLLSDIRFLMSFGFISDERHSAGYLLGNLLKRGIGGGGVFEDSHEAQL
jgi:hypothetical protein